MAKNSKIGWTDHTFNPWWGCTRVSEGCCNCYAANMGRRFGVDWGPGSDRVPASGAMWQQPYRWNRAAAYDYTLKRKPRVFCASMADVFDDHPSILPEWREYLWMTIRDTPKLDWLLLTKRPENFSTYIPSEYGMGCNCNVWLGVSVENQKEADVRIPYLLSTKAMIRFLSVEPMLGPVEIRDFSGIGWVICGGETGPGARPMNLDWARSLRDQCADAGIPFFFKSTGGRRKSDLLDGRTWKEFPA